MQVDKNYALYSQHLSSPIECRLQRKLEVCTSEQIEDKKEGASGTTDRSRGSYSSRACDSLLLAHLVREC